MTKAKKMKLNGSATFTQRDKDGKPINETTQKKWVVADGRNIQCPKGNLHPGDEVRPEYFQEGLKEFTAEHPWVAGSVIEEK
jgi:hypothetical protein